MSRKVTLIASAALVAGVATTALASTFGGVPTLGPASHARVTVYKGYYDGHLDKYLVLDVSSKSQAAALHINYSPRLGHVKGAPPQYFFQVNEVIMSGPIVNVGVTVRCRSKCN